MIKSTILMVIYNGDDVRHLDECMTSIYSSIQFLKSAVQFKLCIQADGNISQSHISVVKKFEPMLDIELTFSKQKKGLTKNLNDLIRLNNNSDYYFRIDPDDLCMPNRFHEQLKFMECNQEILMIGGSAKVIDYDGKFLRLKKMPKCYSEIKRYICLRNPFIHSSVCMRGDFFKKVGLYNEKFIKSQDYELWSCAIKKKIKVANVGTPIALRVSRQQKKRRKSLQNILLEARISLSNIIDSKSFHLLPFVLGKSILRVFS